MPTVQSMDIPKPKNWQDFEKIVRDAQGLKWESSLQMNGRAGQKQSGVDIWGPDHLERPVGIQCKHTTGELSLKLIEKEIALAESFDPLVTLYIATTAAHDALLQKQVRALSSERASKNKFTVGLLYWDEIVANLLLNPAVFKGHFPQLELPQSRSTDRDRLLAALELGYYGADIWESVVLIYGEFGFMAQADPDELLAKLEVLMRRSEQLFAQKDSKPIVSALKKVIAGCRKKNATDKDWHHVEAHAKRASTRVQNAVSLLPLHESKVLNLSLQLGRLYYHQGPVKQKLRADIQKKCTAILSEAREDALREAFKTANKVKDGYKWAMRIYGFLDREIRYSVDEAS